MVDLRQVSSLLKGENDLSAEQDVTGMVARVYDHLGNVWQRFTQRICVETVF